MRGFDVSVGLALRLLREERGMTVLDLVERTGIPGSDLEAYEAGATIPRARLTTLSSALDIGLRAFMGRVVPEPAVEEVSDATPEEGYELIGHFRQIPGARSRRFLIDIAHSLADYE